LTLSESKFDQNGSKNYKSKKPKIETQRKGVVKLDNSKHRKKVLITGILVPESWEEKDEDLEDDIRKELKARDIPWCEKIEKIKVFRESHTL
jgi:hypothetical protein